MFGQIWRLAVLLGIIAFFYIIQMPFHSVASEYEQALWELQSEQKDFQWSYTGAWTTARQKLIIDSARQHIIENIHKQLYPYWKGTRWAYSGTTETPRKGKIACGYFVSTILRDIGLEVERVYLAQQASEKIVKTFAEEKDIQRFRHKPIKSFVKSVIAMGEGLYIVGLDTHVGMMLVEKDKAYFIHSSSSLIGGVKAENPLKSKVLKKSKYRIVGRALPDEVVVKWLEGTPIKTYRGK